MNDDMVCWDDLAEEIEASLRNHACMHVERVSDFLQKPKVQEGSGMNSELPVAQKKLIRQFRQKKPVAVHSSQGKPRLSKDILAGVSVTGQASKPQLFVFIARYLLVLSKVLGCHTMSDVLHSGFRRHL
ncbi:hypothetical protein V6N13_053023 [Hibiscus sabdariffa]